MRRSGLIGQSDLGESLRYLGRDGDSGPHGAVDGHIHLNYGKTGLPHLIPRRRMVF